MHAGTKMEGHGLIYAFREMTTSSIGNAYRIKLTIDNEVVDDFHGYGSDSPTAPIGVVELTTSSGISYEEAERSAHDILARMFRDDIVRLAMHAIRTLDAHEFEEFGAKMIAPEDLRPRRG